ncbi:uncharacterized protein LOC134198691 isoform X2 [Bombyx mori]|uniref:uncharacterized protein LOC134198691 isoform X2 n=1 Tax=Bombyx mori TaxID=7091 RepID=UPI002ED31910
MQYCYPEDCGPFAVAPVLVTSSYPTRCEESPTCYPCLPHCPQSMVYCCDTRPKTPLRRSSCCDSKEFDSRNRNRNHSPPRQNRNSPPPPCRSDSTHKPSSNCCPTCCQPTCQPVKTKYVIPCYRYEDGRIERYVPTRHGRLPGSAYRRNGMQDQIHGYRGAVRYLCAGGNSQGCCVYTTIEPMRRLYPKVTQEINPVKKKKDKK